MEARRSLEVSSNNIIREIFIKTKLLYLSHPKFYDNTQGCVASIEVSSVSKAEDINYMEHCKAVPNKVK